MTRLFSMSIRAQLFLMALIVAVPATGIIVYAGIQSRQGAIEGAFRDSQRLGDGIADEQRNMQAGAEQLLGALAKLPEVKDHDAAAMRAILSGILVQNPRYANIFVADRAGMVWASGSDRESFTIADRRYFKNAIASGKFSSGEYAVGRGSSKRSFHFGYPIKDDDGVITGVLGLGFDLDYFKHILKQARLPQGSSYLLVDHDGVILGRGLDTGPYLGTKDNPELFGLMQGDVGRGEVLGQGVDGRRRVITYRKLRLDHESQPYLYIRSGMPYQAVVAQANGVLLRNLTLFAACLSLAFFLAWLIGKRSIIDRIRVLQSASRRLAAGDLDVCTSDLVTGGELGDLGQAFDHMAREIAARARGQLTTELELRKSEYHYHSIFENSLFGIAVIGKDYRFTQVNNAFCRLLGYSEEELVGKRSLADLTHPDDVTVSIDMARKIFTLELGHYVLEKRYRTRSGNSLEVVVFVQGIHDENGVCSGTTASVLDVTERNTAVQVLKESEENLRTLMEMMPVGVGFHDNEGRIDYVNRRFVEWFGYSKEDIPTIEAWYLKAYPDPDSREAHLATLKAATAEARQNGAQVPPIDAKITCKNGSVRHVIISHQFSRMRSLAIFTDITEREQQQNELLKAQKLDSLGVLAGGIAHDFNNILTGIMGNISIAQIFLEPPHQSCKPLEQAEKASRRAAELAYQLMTFAKGGKPIKKAVSLPHLVHEAVSLVLRGANVKAQVSIPDDIHAIAADEGQISQTFNNIIINAVQAMPQGGILGVTAENVVLGARNTLAQTPGQYVKVSFQDHGCGIPEAALKKVFDPYFTTKAEGTGLGLASVHSIVKKHGGHVEVASSVGLGTTFDFYLPSTGAVWVGEPVGLDSRSSGVQKGGVILVMDDEEMIRTLITQMLGHLGYETRTSVNGEEAIELYRAAQLAGAPFAAVILDLTIPGGMGGQEAAQRILAFDPSARIVVSSGYSNDPVMADYRAHGLSGAVLKPYRVAELEQGLSFLRK